MQAIGIDIASVSRLAAARLRRPAFADRIYTAAEAAYCGDRAERWATRWAAKEAVRKLAGASALPLPGWHDIEVVMSPGGAPHARVHGWGEVVALSLSHDGDLAVAVAVSGTLPTSAVDLNQVILPDRPSNGHKGTFGTVLVVAGSRGLSGAAYLAAMGAARGGAGLVRLCVPESIYATVAVKCTEVMAHPLPEQDGALGPAALVALRRDHLEHADAVVIGCGLGQNSATVAAVLELLPTLPVPTVVDADALNVAAAHNFDWRLCRQSLIVTPHPAEMARLVATTTADVQANRLAIAQDFARSNGVVVVLKGARTIVAAADGRVHVDGHDVVALATGGTGDVLAGLCGAMVAQGLDAFDAAVAAVTIHARAGLFVQAEQGRAGGLASDVMAALPRAQESIRVELENRA